MIDQDSYDFIMEHLDRILQDVDVLENFVCGSASDEQNAKEIKKEIEYCVKVLKGHLSILRDDKTQETLRYLQHVTTI